MQPGMNVGSYRILEKIGLGGMATVFKAYDPGMDRYVAIKIVSPQFAQHPEFRERFRREAKSIAKLEHPHIIPVFAYGEEGETAYLVLRYMDTGTLRDQMNHEPMDFHRARQVIEQIAGALDYAHRHGVIHRDVKPSNVLVDSEGNAYLTDFGIAKIVEATIELTGTGTAMGTPQYMSPEQCRGDKDLTPATDTYSLGVILYQMVTGTLPFDAQTPLAVIYQHLNDPLPPPRTINPHVTEAMERVLFKALAKDPEDRFASTRELSRAFSAAVSKLETVAVPAAPVEPKPSAITEEAPLETQPEPARRLPRWAWATGGVLMAAVLVAGGLLVTRTLGLSNRSEPPTPTSLPAAGAEPPTPAQPSAAAGIADLNPDPALLADPIPFGEHFYSIAREPTHWHEAARIAQELGGYLVSINDPQENEFVHQTFAADRPEDELVLWLGLSAQGEPGAFEWASGEPVGYLNWDQNQPDGIDLGPVCVHMFPWGRWDDVPCADDLRLLALIEFDRLPAPPGAVEAPRPQAVSVVLGPGNVVHGLTQIDFEGDGLTAPAVVGGRKARVTLQNGTGGRFFYFDVDPSFIFKQRSEVLISVEYFDRGTHVLGVDYDSAVMTPAGAFWHTPDVPLEDSGEWRTATFLLEDAYFSGRQHMETDFRIHAGGENDLYVSHVTVARAGSPMAEAIADPWGHVFLGPDEPISLGIAAAFGSAQTEPLAVDQSDAVRLAVEQFGPIHGHPVQILEAPSGCTPDGGRAAAEQLVAASRLAAVIGPTCSSEVAEAMFVFDAARVVFISPSATRDDLGRAGLGTFNRTALPESTVSEGASSDIDPDNPAYQNFAAAFESMFGRPCCQWFAPHAYDATFILLNAIQAVSVNDEAGSMVIPRQQLAAIVRDTHGWPGASGEIYFDEAGNRILP